ncbi:MAG: PAS domain-containing protein, partial [Gemmatimonadaceae bacterium]|nr:PAS domain-containing protein [Gemmatimonadaceae bacterium]
MSQQQSFPTGAPPAVTPLATTPVPPPLLVPGTGLASASAVIGIGEWLLHESLELVWFDESIGALLGLPPRTMVTSRELLAVIEPVDHLLVRTVAQATRDQGDPVDVRWRLRPTADRPARTIRVVGRRRPDGGKWPVAGVALDVTAEAQAADTARAYHERLELAQRAGSVGIFDTDMRTMETWWSDALRAIYGLPPHAEATQATWSALVHPDDRAAADAALQAAIAARAPLLDHELRIHRPADGALRWVRTRAELTYDPVSGAPRRGVGSVTDITEVRERQELAAQVERRTRVALAALNGIIYEWDIGANRVHRTDGLQRLLGFAPHEVPVDAGWWHSRIHPDDLPAARARGDEILSRGLDHADAQYRVRHRDGYWVWVWDHMRILRDDEGRLRGLVGCTIDITAQRAMQAALAASEAEAQTSARRLMIALAAINGIVFEWDVRGDSVTRSEGLLQLVGWRHDEVPSTPRWWQGLIHPDDRAEAIARCTTLAEGRADTDALQYRVRHRDGRWVQVWEYMRVLRDDGGSVTHVLGCAIDVSAQAETRERLGDTERRLAIALGAVGMGRWDLDFRSGLAHIDAAEAALLGLPAGTTVCSLDAFLALIHPDDRDAVRNRVTEAVEHHGGAYAAEFRVVHPDGSERWLVGRGVIEADAQTGVPVRAIGINYDVTERRRADEALRASELQARASEQRAEAALREAQAANTAKDQFLAVLSHELRTPLAPVLLVTSMLLRSGLLPEALRDHVATIKRNVELEVKLIDDLLDLTRIARGKLELHLAPVDLAETTRQVVQMVQPDAAARDITVDVSLDALQCQVRGDAARLHQVLWNLLRNAVKFTPAGGRVTVRSRCVEDVVVVDVRDTGIGIEPHVMPRIFSAF